MSKKYFYLFLFFSVIVSAQNCTETDSTILTLISRKKVFEIKYNKEHWIKNDQPSKWDSEFHDPYNLVNIYFSEFDYFFNTKNLKLILKKQYEGVGKVKKLNIYNKTINKMEGNYFECELEYNDSVYIFQGFVYNGKGGTMEIQFGLQEEALKHYQESINEFCNGISVLN